MANTRTPAAAGPTIPIGQAVGQAETILSKLLAGVLAETGTSRQTYLAMQRLTVLGGDANGDSSGGVSRDRYVADLGYWLDLDLPSADRLVDSLAAAGFIAVPAGNVRLTAAGTDLLGKIRAAAGKVTARLYEPLNPADVATTIRTLQEITTRARGLR